MNRSRGIKVCEWGHLYMAHALRVQIFGSGRFALGYVGSHSNSDIYPHNAPGASDPRCASENTLYRVSRNDFLWAEQSGMTYCRMPHLALMPNCEN